MQVSGFQFRYTSLQIQPDVIILYRVQPLMIELVTNGSRSDGFNSLGGSIDNLRNFAHLFLG